MGKKLIIKGADFSVNGIHESVVYYATDETGTTEASAFWSANAKRVGYFNADAQTEIQGKPINYVKVGVKSFGSGSSTFSNCCLWKYHTNTGEAEIVTNFSITNADLNAGYKVIQFPQMTLSNTEELYVGFTEPVSEDLSCKYPLLFKYDHTLDADKKMSVLKFTNGTYSSEIPQTTEGTAGDIVVTYCRIKIEVGLL